MKRPMENGDISENSTDIACIKEGKAIIRLQEQKIPSRKMPVFYNPVMTFNRDVSVRLINALGRKDLQVALPLAGTGIRGIRLCLETDAIRSMHYNDLSERATDLIRQNLRLNNLEGEVSCMHASSFLLNSKGFDYIDIDPFGSPNSFLDASIKRLSRDSILAVTATDTAPLCGTYPNACRRKYWAFPLREDIMHEAGLRILIRKIQMIGAQYDRALIPIMSYSKDHYFRVFFGCKKGKVLVDEILKDHKFLRYCPECLERGFTIDSTSECHMRQNNAGPMWVGRLNDPDILDMLDIDGLDAKSQRFLNVLKEESRLDNHVFVDIHGLYKRFDLGSVKKTDFIIETLKKNGFKGCRSHFSDVGIKTDATVAQIIRLLF